MSAKVSPKTTGSGLSKRFRRLPTWIGQTNRVGMITLAVFVFGVAVILLYKPLDQLELSDGAIYDYCAQTVLRGKTPYRDAIDGKGPVYMYVGALGMFIGRAMGLRDVIAVRLLYVLLTGLLLIVIFLVTNAYLHSRLAAIIASLTPLMIPNFVLLTIHGAQPKLLMIAFGMLSLLLISKDRPFWAGLASSLSFLSWQPGLIFCAVVLLAFSRYFRSWRDIRALKAATGAVVPILVVALYFYSANALADMWTWTVTFNYSIYARRIMRSNPIGNIWAITSEMFGRKLVFVLIALGGALIYSLQRFVSIGRDQVYSKPGSSELRGALLIPPAAYLAFSLFHFQGPDDVIPLCPFIGIFAGYFFVQLVNSASLLSRGKVFAYLRSLIPMFASFAIVALIIASRVSYIEEPGGTLKNQSEAYQAISNALSPDDKIYVHGAVEILVLLNRANLNQYIYVDRGRDEYINEHTPGGFKSLIDAMESEAPKIVCLAHMGKRKTSYGWMLFEWTAEHYEELPLSLFNETSVFIRKK